MTALPPEDIDAWTQQFLADRREAFALPLDLAKVRAYCHKYEQAHFAELPDPLLTVVAYQCRTIDLQLSDEERQASAEWLQTEGQRVMASIATDPDVRAASDRAMERQQAADRAAGEAIRERLKRRP